ncbi:MAG: hypothetical protein EBU90_25280 [Proteobacteria bacterium]|nr:hypothetical protein [Pseudomonadota bacterium]
MFSASNSPDKGQLLDSQQHGGATKQKIFSASSSPDKGQPLASQQHVVPPKQKQFSASSSPDKGQLPASHTHTQLVAQAPACTLAQLPNYYTHTAARWVPPKQKHFSASIRSSIYKLNGSLTNPALFVTPHC